MEHIGMLKNSTVVFATKISPAITLHTRAASAAQPPIGDATNLLLSTQTGIRIFEKSSSLSDNLLIRKSGVADEAGNGLYIAAKTSDLRIEAEQVITWFSGEIQYADIKNPKQLNAKCYTIGLGSTKKNAAQVIISDPENRSLLGCAHFANHSTKPNCKLQYLEGDNGIIAVLLVATKGFTLPQDHALELVFDYGSSAVNIHGIVGDCDYHPHVKPMLHFDEEDGKTSFLMPYPDDTIDTHFMGFSNHFYEAEMRKKLETDSRQMQELAQKSLPEGSFSLITTPERGVFRNLFDRQEPFYFIRLAPDLDKMSWILMGVLRTKPKNKIYFLDPEGLLLDKVSHEWFSELDLTSTEMYFFHSWFAYNRMEDKGYSRTICVALAKLLAELNDFLVQPVKVEFRPGVGAQFPEAEHDNFDFVPYDEKSTLLSELLVHYPERRSTLLPKNIKENILKINELLREDKEIQVPQLPQVSPDSEGEELTKIIMPHTATNSSSFFSKGDPKQKREKIDVDVSILANLLHTFCPNIPYSKTDIQTLLESGSAADQLKLWDFCNHTENSPENLKTLEKLFLESFTVDSPSSLQATPW